MKCLVSLATRAELDRDRAFAWYAANYSEAFALRWLDELLLALRSLASDPQHCSKADISSKLPFDLYELRLGRRRNKHRILFRIQDHEVIVLHIRHSAQRELTKRDFEGM